MGTDYNENSTAAEMVKLPGIKDLRLAVASKFIKALKLEAKGEHAEAYKALEAAIEAEQSPS
jgi:hypothetical protein